MASSKRSSTVKPPKGRPVSTSAISQPALAETLPILSSFSVDGTLFALVTLAIDKHRLRVYNSVSGRAIAEHTIQAGRVSSLIWSTSTLGAASSVETESPNKKRRLRRAEEGEERGESCTESEVVILGLSDGTVLLFSPVHSQIIRTLAHATSTSSILALAPGISNKAHLWTSSSDSSINLWDAHKNSILRSWKTDDRIPYTALSVRPPSSKDDVDLLAAHHHIRLFSGINVAQEPTSIKPNEKASFTGHASSIGVLRWAKAIETSHRFFSIAEGDRFIYVWEAEGASTNQKPVASISLDSEVRSIWLNTSDPSKQILIALSTSGKLSFFPIPTDFPRPQSTGDKPHKINSLLPRTTLGSVSSKSDPPVVNLVCTSGNPGSLRVVRIVKGVKPVFDVVRYLDDNGNYIQQLGLNEIDLSLADEGLKEAENKRYLEPTSMGVGSGIDPDFAEGNEDSVAQREIDGSLQVDLAELSLGQRLAAVAEGDVDVSPESDEEELAPGVSRNKSSKKSSQAGLSVIPANSLTRTLIQALHSSDSRLLEMCLAHPDPLLIRNTVRRLPPQLAIPLINACVERLGRGARAANMKGRGGGASSQRGTGLVTWVNTVLAVHTGHLMTIPDLVARLSGLHATLTARLSLHDSLLSLSGRLDTVLSQVEYRASTTPASFSTSRGKATKAKQETVVKRYVEGETESEEEDDADMEVEVEQGSEDEESMEDVELGGESGSEDEEGDSEDSEGGNDFIDDEAEEEYSDEEDEDDSE